MRAVEKTSEGGWNRIVLPGGERMSEREIKDGVIVLEGREGRPVGSPRGEYKEFLVLLFYPIQSESRPAQPCIPFDIDDPMHMHVGVCEYDTSFLFFFLFMLMLFIVVVALPRHNIDPLVRRYVCLFV